MLLLFFISTPSDIHFRNFISGGSLLTATGFFRGSFFVHKTINKRPSLPSQRGFGRGQLRRVAVGELVRRRGARQRRGVAGRRRRPVGQVAAQDTEARATRGAAQELASGALPVLPACELNLTVF